MQGRYGARSTLSAIAVASVLASGSVAGADRDAATDSPSGEHLHAQDEFGREGRRPPVQVGSRPLYLVDGMDESPLKRRLLQCQAGPFRRTDFSIGHRGAPLQFPEHTRESYVAAARQGAGIVECDVTFTSDGGLVCRHAQNDLHTTTNILTTPLAASCRVPFTPAVVDPGGRVTAPATAECRTSELTTEQFLTLRAKMDAFDPSARTAQEFQGGTAPWRTDLYTGRGTLVTFGESLRLNQWLGVKHTPELKAGDPASIAAVFGSQRGYALALAQEMRRAGVRPRETWPQSFNVEDVFTWIDETEYGAQAVYLLDYDATDAVNDVVIQAPYDRMNRTAYFRMLKQRGVKVIAPAMPSLLAVDAQQRVVPSKLAKELKAMGFQIVTWTFERSDLRRGASRAGFYYDFDSKGAAIRKDADMYEALDVLARQVGIIGIFSDWPATVTYYANCMNLR